MRISDLHLQASILAIAAGAFLPAAALAQQAPASAQPAPPADKKPDPIVVTGTRADVNARADRLSFDVTKDLQVQTGTLADAMRSVPGVEVDLEGRISLRGDPGVKILVDGRESALFSGEGRSNAVLTMPANQIERVEVITNPSAAMSPEGSGGVINLVMKKARPNTRYATLRGNIGGEDRYSLSVNGVSSGPKLTLTGDVSLRRFNADAEQRLDRVRTVPAETSRRTVDLDVLTKGHNARIAADYDFDKANRLTTEVNYYNFANGIDSDESFDSSIASSSYDRISETDITSKGGSGRLSWRKTFPGQEHELVSEVSTLLGRFNRDVGAEISPQGAPSLFEAFDYGGKWDWQSLKSEYKRPMGKDSSLNVGYNGNFNHNEFDYFGARGPSANSLAPVAAFTNQFQYDETIHAVFATYNFRIGKIEALTGLRLEQVELDINQITDNRQFENDYFRAYPTLHLGIDLSQTQKLRGSYSRRIQRPGPQDLNPYTVYIDPLNQRRGNPFLKPQVTDSFELSWQLRKGANFYSLTGFYRDAKDGVTDIFTDLGGGVILTTRDNLATSRSIGVDAIANGKLTNTMTYNASATYQSQQIDPRVGGVAQKSDGTTGTVRGNLNWQPTANDFFQLNGNYSGRQLLPQGYREPGGILNVGYRRKVNDKLSLLVTGQNMLDSARFRTVYRTPTTTEESRHKGTGRIIFLGATYTLGNTNGRPRREQGFDFQQGGSDPVQ
jgi:outer membrane receptor protein involved in Fe transport